MAFGWRLLKFKTFDVSRINFPQLAFASQESS
jgi:hypothetical protein